MERPILQTHLPAMQPICIINGIAFRQLFTKINTQTGGIAQVDPAPLTLRRTGKKLQLRISKACPFLDPKI